MIGQCRNCHHVVGIVHLNNKPCHTCLETDMEVGTDTINSQKIGKSLHKLLPTMFTGIVVPATLFMGMIIAIAPREC